MRYSERTWGRDQRNAYRLLIDDAFERLLDFPEIGRVRVEVAEGIRSYPIGEHVIWYGVEANDMVIFRVLHRKMNPAEYLGRDIPSP
jgi:toxin ParE1/3/4